MARWIVIDGIDGAGKTTVARWIEEYYRSRGQKVLVQVHPSARPVGRMARACLQGQGPHLYALASVFYMLDVLSSLLRLRKWMAEYNEVIFVRYLLAAAYLPRRYAQLGYDLFARTLPVPSRLILVDVDPRVALERISRRQDRVEMFENLSSLAATRKKVLMLADGWDVLRNDGDEPLSRKQLIDILSGWE
jgi:dTMP kinase